MPARITELSLAYRQEKLRRVFLRKYIQATSTYGTDFLPLYTLHPTAAHPIRTHQRKIPRRTGPSATAPLLPSFYGKFAGLQDLQTTDGASPNPLAQAVVRTPRRRSDTSTVFVRFPIPLFPLLSAYRSEWVPPCPSPHLGNQSVLTTENSFLPRLRGQPRPP